MSPLAALGRSDPLPERLVGLCQFDDAAAGVLRRRYANVDPRESFDLDGMPPRGAAPQRLFLST